MESRRPFTNTSSQCTLTCLLPHPPLSPAEVAGLHHGLVLKHEALSARVCGGVWGSKRRSRRPEERCGRDKTVQIRLEGVTLLNHRRTVGRVKLSIVPMVCSDFLFSCEVLRQERVIVTLLLP